MFCDITFPKGNEEEFIKTAEKLGVEALAFAYTYSDKKAVEKTRSNVDALQKLTKVKLFAVFDVQGNKIYKVHDLSEVAISPASEDSRDTIARYQPDLVYDLELSKEKDFAKFRNSGMDKAIAQFAHTNNVVVAFAFSSILNSENQPKLVGRMMQNIKLCRKHKIKTAIASFALTPYEMRSPHDLKSFLLSIGMHTAQAKQSTETVSELFS